MAFSPLKCSLRGSLNRVEELDKTQGGVENKIQDPEESNYMPIPGRVRTSDRIGVPGKYHLQRASPAGSGQEIQCLKNHALKAADTQNW